jgi:hypothetical protein
MYELTLDQTEKVAGGYFNQLSGTLGDHYPIPEGNAKHPFLLTNQG